MAAIALIKFDQADGSGSPAGEAHEATFYYAPDLSKNAITVTNGDNTDVASWKIELLYNPPASALGAVPGTPVVLGQATSNTPSAPFTMDAPEGSYRIRLTVWDGTGTSNVDVRDVVVRTGRGFVVPPYQKLPDPLPIEGEGVSGEKPGELNVGGQAYGWLGGDGDGFHQDFITKYDDLPNLWIDSGTSFTARAEYQEPLYGISLGDIGADFTFNLPTSGWRTGQRFRIQAWGPPTYKVTLVPPAGHNINGLSSVDFRPFNTAVVVYLGNNNWTLLGAKYDRYERNLVAGVENVSVIGFQSVGSSAYLDADDFPNGVFSWRAVIETTDALDAAEIRLYNVTAASPVAGSTLSTTSLIPVVVEAPSVALSTTPSVYEAQLRLQTTGSPNQATCRQAQILAQWLQP